MTVTVARGDVLGALFLFLPVLTAAHVIVMFSMSGMLGSAPKAKDWLFLAGVLAPLGLTSWGLWELAHWFAA